MLFTSIRSSLLKSNASLGVVDVVAQIRLQPLQRSLPSSLPSVRSCLAVFYRISYHTTFNFQVHKLCDSKVLPLTGRYHQPFSTFPPPLACSTDFISFFFYHISPVVQKIYGAMKPRSKHYVCKASSKTLCSITPKKKLRVSQYCSDRTSGGPPCTLASNTHL